VTRVLSLFANRVETLPLVDQMDEIRQRMVKFQIESRGVKDKDVLNAMQTVPRDAFVPEEFAKEAYEDHPVPIGYGQTISQPYIVAVMTELLQLRRDSRVLEVGTGSGYQAAILAELAEHVYTVEIVQTLCEAAKKRMAGLGLLKCVRKVWGRLSWLGGARSVRCHHGHLCARPHPSALDRSACRWRTHGNPCGAIGSLSGAVAGGAPWPRDKV